MRRYGRVLVLLAAGVGLSTPRAAAQTNDPLQVWYDLQLSGDSVVGVLEGQSFDLTLYAYDYGVSGLDAFVLRVPFDSTKLAYVAATKLCPDLAAPLNVTAGAGYVDLSTASCKGNSYNQPIVRLTFRLRSGVMDGTFIGLAVTSLIDNRPLDRTADFQGDLAEVCHATGLWGDVDHDLVINSRDALVAISNAVGLPTPGFDLSAGDVDADGWVTSRDALFLLFSSIGLPTAGYRVGKGIADRCAPQARLPRRLYFNRYGAYVGQVGLTGLGVRAADPDTSVTIVGDSADAYQSYQWRPRVAPGGTVLFVCMNASLYPNICTAQPDGSNPVRLTTGFTTDQSPDWSPDTTQIVFVRNGQIYRMNADGSNPAVIPASPTGVTSVAWQPVAFSNRVAYTSGIYGATAGVHRRSLDTASTDSIVAAAPLCCALYDFRSVDWSPAGDSLVYDAYLNGQRAVMVSPNTIGAVRAARVSLADRTQHPAWTDQGLLFVTLRGQYDQVYLLKPDGTAAPVIRDPSSNLAPGMRRQ